MEMSVTEIIDIKFSSFLCINMFNIYLEYTICWKWERHLVFTGTLFVLSVIDAAASKGPIVAKDIKFDSNKNVFNKNDLKNIHEKVSHADHYSIKNTEATQ